MYLFGIPGSGFGPAIAYSFVKNYSVGWRGIYWLLLGGQVVALACWTLFYFPPNFHKKHRRDIDSKIYWIKNFDYVGLFLFTVGFLPFLLGLSWGGGAYPWKSAAVIASIVGGFAVLVLFVLYEAFGPVKEPLVPMHLFKNGAWVSASVLLSIGASVCKYTKTSNLRMKSGTKSYPLGVEVFSMLWIVPPVTGDTTEA